MLVVELILRGAHHSKAIPLMSSSWKNNVVPRRWNAAFERSLNMDSTHHSHSYNYKFSRSTENFYWKSLSEQKLLI
jgi:hypothetical protein